MQEEIRKLLGLDEKADVLEAVKALKSKSEGTTKLAEVEDLKGKVATLETKLSESAKTLALKERDERVSKAVSSGKVLPAQKPWADEYALKDPAGFDAFVTGAPVVIKLGELGTQGGKPEDVQLTESEIKVAEEMGVSKETLIKSKKEVTN